MLLGEDGRGRDKAGGVPAEHSHGGSDGGLDGGVLRLQRVGGRVVEGGGEGGVGPGGDLGGGGRHRVQRRRGDGVFVGGEENVEIDEVVGRIVGARIGREHGGIGEVKERAGQFDGFDDRVGDGPPVVVEEVIGRDAGGRGGQVSDGRKLGPGHPETGAGSAADDGADGFLDGVSHGLFLDGEAAAVAPEFVDRFAVLEDRLAGGVDHLEEPAVPARVMDGEAIDPVDEGRAVESGGHRRPDPVGHTRVRPWLVDPLLLGDGNEPAGEHDLGPAKGVVAVALEDSVIPQRFARRVHAVEEDVATGDGTDKVRNRSGVEPVRRDRPDEVALVVFLLLEDPVVDKRLVGFEGKGQRDGDGEIVEQALGGVDLEQAKTTAAVAQLPGAQRLAVFHEFEPRSLRFIPVEQDQLERAVRPVLDDEVPLVVVVEIDLPRGFSDGTVDHEAAGPSPGEPGSETVARARLFKEPGRDGGGGHFPDRHRAGRRIAPEEVVETIAADVAGAEKGKTRLHFEDRPAGALDRFDPAERPGEGAVIEGG